MYVCMYTSRPHFRDDLAEPELIEKKRDEGGDEDKDKDKVVDENTKKKKKKKKKKE